jgi:fused signal recognition particle receptor
MFGWGKKKQIKETIVENQSTQLNIAQTGDNVPLAVLVLVANSNNQIAQIEKLLLARANSIKSISQTTIAHDGLGIALTLMVNRGAQTSNISNEIHEAARLLALEISLLGQCFLVNTDEFGNAISTTKIDSQKFEPTIEDKKGLFSGLARTSTKIAGGIGAIFTQSKLDDASLDELEDLLIMSDMGVETAREIRTIIEKKRFERGANAQAIKEEVALAIEEMLLPYEVYDNPWVNENGPRVIMFVGVNGSGKTTTIGKVAQNLVDNGHNIMLAAADTFRAAASEQLLVWGARAGVEVIAKESGADAAGLAFEALQKAQAQKKDVLLIDTAGRLQNKAELMAELAKVVRVIKKVDESAPHEVWLVLDATVGQNALSQAEAFSKTAGVTGLIMSKLDGTAKGGVLLALSKAYKLPIRFVGVGERVEDLQPFAARNFARALMGLEI